MDGIVIAGMDGTFFEEKTCVCESSAFLTITSWARYLPPSLSLEIALLSPIAVEGFYLSGTVGLGFPFFLSFLWSFPPHVLKEPRYPY